jgi:predicted PurR-regulated permease PerM
MNNEPLAGERNQIRSIVEMAIRLALLFILLYWCYSILKPFIDILLWAIIFAIALYPLYEFTNRRLKKRKKLSAVIIVVLMLVVLAIPGFLFASSLIEGVTSIKEQYETAGKLIPEASEKVASWPVIGTFLYEKWNWFSQHMDEALKEYSPQIKEVMISVFSSIASAGAAFLKLILSIIIAGLLLISAEKGGQLASSVFVKIIGERGAEFAVMAEKTIRTVVRGIVGVAFIQSLLYGIGMIAVGVPAAGLWFIISLILGIIQVGIFPVSIPVLIYVFMTKSTVVAVIFLIWTIIISPIDNVLKPILLGKGAVVPMPVIFVGAIGGFIYSGLVGLFTGAVVFSVGYKLFQFWLEEN